MNILEFSIVITVGFMIGKFFDRLSSGRCGYCGGYLYIENGETLCEKCGAKV